MEVKLVTRPDDTGKEPCVTRRSADRLAQAGDTFRISRSDLHLRPVFHKKTGRVEAPMMVCFLTLALWRALEAERNGDRKPRAAHRANRTRQMWMRGKGVSDCPRQPPKEVPKSSTVSSMDVVLPLRRKAEAGNPNSSGNATDKVTGLFLLVMTRPFAQSAQWLARLGLALPSAPRLAENVARKIRGNPGNSLLATH